MMTRFNRVALLLLTALLFTGCNVQPEVLTKPNSLEDSDLQLSLVETIHIFEAMPPGYPPPPGGWALMQTGPHPTNVQRVFAPRDKMNLGLAISGQIETDVTFSRFTFFNKGTGTEVEIEAPDQMGPFEPGAKVLLGFSDPWEVPDDEGEYELRVYLSGVVVASVPFSVSIQSASDGQ